MALLKASRLNEDLEFLEKVGWLTRPDPLSEGIPWEEGGGKPGGCACVEGGHNACGGRCVGRKC